MKIIKTYLSNVIKISILYKTPGGIICKDWYVSRIYPSLEKRYYGREDEITRRCGLI